MVRRKRVLTERAAEAKMSKKSFSLPVPSPQDSRKEKEAIFEKTSLYVPRDMLFTDKTNFRPSSLSKEVLVSRNIPEVLKVIFKHGDVAKRYGEGALEEDSGRQQIIVYTMVVCQNNLLWYQRSAPEVKKVKKFVGDPRLQGRFAVGFGGHKTWQDIYLSREELVFLKDLLPAVQDEIGTILGLNRGFFNEVEEEIGISKDDIQYLKLLGAFYDKRIEDPLLAVQVGWVHTAIAAVLEVNPQTAQYLTFRTSEIAKAWWVPFAKVEKELKTKQEDWFKGKGPKVETWSEIMIKEFWEDYFSNIRKS